MNSNEQTTEESALLQPISTEIGHLQNNKYKDLVAMVYPLGGIARTHDRRDKETIIRVFILVLL